MSNRSLYTVLTIFLLIAVPTYAQGQAIGNDSQQAILPLTYGIDPQRDSATFVRFRQHMDSIRATRPTVALVLSGGGAKGAAHIPIIQYLEREHIPIDLVLGTSIGGLIGGLYACGYNGDELEALMSNRDWNTLLRDVYERKYNTLDQKDYDRQFQISIPYGSYKWDFHKPEISYRSILPNGIVQGRNIENLFASLLVGYEGECDFLTLPTPFVCVAADMITAKQKIWFCGNLIEAMRSTMSIPGLFSPVKTNGMVLLDGSMRNNFPAEIAHQLGADIIIGVDISSPSLKAGEMNNILDIVFQTTDVLGREAYDAALATTDIYIQPDVTDFSLLSFDKESIATIIDRGRQAVEAHADQLQEIKKIFNNLQNPYLFPRYPVFRKAVNLNVNPIPVDSVVFNGINHEEERYLRKLIHSDSKIKGTAHIIDLDDAISTLMGTKAFEKVTYQILGEEPPYTVCFNCYRSPNNQVGASIRFDANDYAAVLLHIGINAHRLTDSRIDFTARLGLNTILTAAYTLGSGRGFDWITELSFQSVRNGTFRSEPYTFLIDFNKSRADMALSFALGNATNLSIGYRADWFYRKSMLVDYGILGYAFENIGKSNIYIGPYVKLRSDTFDDPYFPVKGIHYGLSYNWYMQGLLNVAPSTHAVQASFKSAISKGRFTLIPFADARYISADIVPYINMLSISDANKSLDQQITFIGISTPVSALRTIGSVGLSSRVRIGNRHYVSVSAQLMHEAQQPTEYFDPNASFTYYGYALEYAFKSIAGPIRANIHWSDLNNKLGFYLGFGLEF